MPDDRRADIEHAVNTTVRKLLDLDLSVAEAVAALGRVEDAVAGDVRTYRERAHELRAARWAAIMAEMTRLVELGRGRSAATMTARKFARDPHDLGEIESLSQQVRRRWRGKKRS